jgi:hypothetical protein
MQRLSPAFLGLALVLHPAIALAELRHYTAALTTSYGDTKKGEAACDYDTGDSLLACTVTFDGIRPLQAEVGYTRPITGDNTVFAFANPSTSPLSGKATLDLFQQIELGKGTFYVALWDPYGGVRGKLERQATDAGAMDAGDGAAADASEINAGAMDAQAAPEDASSPPPAPPATPSGAPEGCSVAGLGYPSLPASLQGLVAGGLALVVAGARRRRRIPQTAPSSFAALRTPRST